MNLPSPISSEQIREEIAKIVEKIQEETKWDMKRNLTDVSISFGEAPEFGSDFGTVRMSDSIIFANWIENLIPDTFRFNILEFLIIREAFSFFFEAEVLFGNLLVVTEYLQNILAYAYLRKAYDRKSMEIKFTHVRSKFLFNPRNLSSEETRLHNKRYELISIVTTQSISYSLLFNSYLHFIEDLVDEEIDFEEILNYLIRYLSNSPLEIAAPIRLRRNSLSVLESLVNIGFDASTRDIANHLNLNHTTVNRELIKIASRYIAVFRVEKNFHKLGLNHHLIIIKYKNGDSSSTEEILDLLKSNRYIFEIYSGLGSNFNYVYCLTLCPYIVAENLIFKLRRFENKEIIEEFDVIPLKNRIFRSAFVEDSFSPSIANFKRLIDSELDCTKLVTFENTNFEEDSAYRFAFNEKKLLWLISAYQSNGIVHYNHFRGFTSELRNLLVENGQDWDDMASCIDFLNNIRRSLIEKKLIDFRLSLSISNLAVNEMLVVKIQCDPDDNRINSLLDKLNVFGGSVVHKGYDHIFLLVYSVHYQHPLAELIVDEFKTGGFDCEVFSVKNIVWRFVPLHDLYSFEDQKWLLR